MGKHTKLTKKAAPVEAPKPVPATSDIDATLQETLEFLQELLRTCKGAIETTPALLRESSGVARAIVQLSGEQRARRKAFVRDARALSRSIVMEYLRGIELLERQNVIRELVEADEEGSVLA